MCKLFLVSVLAALQFARSYAGGVDPYASWSWPSTRECGRECATNATNASLQPAEALSRRLSGFTVSVSNVRFTDEKSDDKGIAGTITWDPPASWPNTGAQRAYRAYLINHPFDPTLHYAGVNSYMWWEDSEGFYPEVNYGTNKLTMWHPNGFINRQVAISGQPLVSYANYIAVICKNGGEYTSAASLDPTAAMAIYDVWNGGSVPDMVIDTAAADGGIQFSDTDMSAGGIAGSITWTLKDVDTAFVEYFKVYLTDDAAGNNPLVVSETVPMSYTPSVNIAMSRQGRGFFRIVANNQHGDSTTAAVKAIYDATGSRPSVQVTNLAFTDADNRVNYIRGDVTWTAPTDVATFETYQVYFAMDAAGTGKSLQAEVPAGTNRHIVPADTDRQAMDHLLVYTKNSFGPSDTPAVIRLVDLTSGPPTERVASVTFTDTNSMFRVIEGTIQWLPGDEAAVSRYEVYLSASTSGVASTPSPDDSLLGTVSLGTTQLVLSSPTSLVSGATVFSYIYVYAANAQGRSSAFTYITINDAKATCTHYTCPAGSSAKASAPDGCSGTSCTDSECCEAAGRCSDASFSCGAGWILKATVPNFCSDAVCATAECCDRGAEAPANVTATNPGHDSMVVVWEVPTVHDCIFQEYEVQYQPVNDPGVNFTSAAGCTNLRDICTSQCTATSLPSQTSMQFRVRVSCAVTTATDLSSAWSLSSAGVATLPHRAEAPSNVNIYGISNNRAWVSWQAGALNDCVLSQWAITVKNSLTGQAVATAPTCSTPTNCMITGLSCITAYTVEVAASCATTLANSPTSTAAQFTTLRGLACVVPATNPTAVTLSQATVSSIQISWTGGTPGDCNFTQWTVEVRPENRATWATPQGCSDLVPRETVQCVATGLQSNVHHEARVREECNNTYANSGWATTSSTLQTLIRPAEAPANPVASSPTQTSMLVRWDVPSIHDCVFNEYVVQWRLADAPGSAWAVPAGCSGLHNACESLCTATGLPSNSSVAYRIRVSCVSATADGGWSAETSPVSTLPVPSMPPTGLAVSGISSSGATVSWTAGSLEDCAFSSWVVVVRDLATNTVVEPQADCENLDLGTTTCTVGNLGCNTQHSVTVAAKCSDPQANSIASTAVQFTTIRGGASACLLPAVSPSSVAASNSTTSSLQLSWTAGDARNCAFTSWSVEVRPINSAFWTTASGCEGLTTRTQSQCTVTGLQSNTGHDFRVKEECSNSATNSEWGYSPASVSTSIQPADAPTGVTAGSPTTSSLLVQWQASDLHDCTFSHFVVEWRPAFSSDPWAVPSGCTGLTSACEVQCTAGGLPSNAQAVFRVSVACAATGANSAHSVASLPAATRPVPSAAPTGVTVTNVASSTARVSWTAAALNDCTFDRWSVVVTDGATGQPVTPQADCQSLSFGTAECDIGGLTCNTDHSVQVSAFCSDSSASSVASTAATFRTTRGGTQCLLRATLPSSLAFASATRDSLQLSWTAGEARDCVFSRWSVELRPANRATWTAAQGCAGLSARGTTQCTAVGLQSNTLHEFRVMEECTISNASSSWSVSSTSAQTLIRPSEAPINVVASNPTQSSLLVVWEAFDLHDCAFTHFVVEWRPAFSSDPWAVPSGCVGLTSACEVQCTAGGLPSNAQAVFRVSVACAATGANSVPSVASLPAATRPVPSAAPTGVTVTNVASSTARVSWTAAALNDCTFDRWSVMVTDMASGQQVTPQANCQSLSFGTAECDIGGLTCNTDHSVQVLALCSDSFANSAASTTVTFRTTRGGTQCLLRAMLPSSLAFASATQDSLQLSWAAGEARDCVFSRWSVEIRPANRAMWTAAQGCAGLSARGTTQCTALGLQSNTLHEFRVMEECTNVNASSSWSVSSTSAQTLLRPSEAPINVVASSPTQSSLVVVWEAADFHDCVFSQYVVEWRPASSSAAWSVPSGCAALASPCEVQCTAGGLPANAQAVFRVSVACASAGANSAVSAVSTPSATLPVPSAAPTGVTVTNIASTSARVSWTAAALNDCSFTRWSVVVTDVADGQPVTPQAACESLGFGTVECDIGGLTCNTDHSVQVSAVCSDSFANSVASTAATFKTTRGGTLCLLPAARPGSLIASNPTQDSLQLSWTAGEARDCVFSQWLVEIRPANRATWAPAQGCSGLASRAAAGCTAAGLQSNMLHEFRVMEECTNANASSTWSVSTASVQTLIRRSEAPVGVVASSPTLHSLLVMWEAADFHDCVFSHYVVQWRPAASSAAWRVPSGCAALTSPCEVQCTAGGLPSNAQAVFRVSVACASSSADSAASIVSSPAATQPVPSAAPTGVAVTNIASTSAHVSWTAAALNDCTFVRWSVVVTDVANGQPVTPQANCENLGFGTVECDIGGLTCNTDHSVKVSAVCSSPFANSAASTAVTFGTTRGGTQCLLPATRPRSLAASNATQETLQLSWVAGEARDCVFTRWLVEVRPANRARWAAAQGCEGLTTRGATQCTAAGLQSNTPHEFRVMEECTNANASSTWSVSDTSVQTLVRPSEAPVGVVASSPSTSELAVRWEVAVTNDCLFRRYVVQWRPAANLSSPWLEPAGCTEVLSACTSACTAGGLPSNTAVVFRVAVDCFSPASASGFSSLSTAVATRPVPASPPTSVAVPAADVVDHSARVTWQAAALNDCTFSKWNVVVTNAQTNFAVTPQAACDQIGSSASGCSVSGLSCDTPYTVQVSVKCSDTNGDGALSAPPVSFRTLPGQACFSPATRPTSVYGTEPSFTTLRAVWTPGAANDCTFVRWQVDFRIAGVNGGPDTVFTPQGCGDLNSRAVTACLATGLHENTPYYVRVQEICSDVTLNSGMAESSNAASTKVVPQPQVIMQDPFPGSAIPQRLEQVLIVFSDSVELNGSSVLHIRSSDSVGLCAMPAATSSRGFRLQNGRIALWPVNRSLWKQGCQYQLEVEGGLFVTALKPEKAVPQLVWDFTYNATVPSLKQVALASAASESLAVGVAWDLNVVFQCEARLSGSSGVAAASSVGGLGAFKDELVTVSFTGLAPAQVYEVYCRAEVQEDRLVRSDWYLTGSWETAADTNRFLRSLTVNVVQECPDNTTSASKAVPLSPTFQRDVTAYQAVVASVDPQLSCSGSSSGAESVWRISLSAEKESAYANFVMAWAGGELVFDRSNQVRRLRLPAGAAFAEMNTTVTVSAMATSVAPLSYTVSFLAMQVQFQVGTPRLYDSAGAQVAATADVQENWKMEVDVSYTGMQVTIPLEFWTRLSIFLGPFDQFTAVRSGASGYTLEVNQLLGLGRDLPLQVRLEGAVMGQAPTNMSFVNPVIDCVSTSQASCNKNVPVVVDTVNETTLYANGFGFGTHRLLFQDPSLGRQVLRLDVTSSASSASGLSLCSSSQWVSSRQLKCTLHPAAPPPLELALYGPSGSQVAQLLTFGTLQYQPPVVQSVQPPVLPLAPGVSGDNELYIVGGGFPNFTVGDLQIQLRSTSSSSGRRLNTVLFANPCRQVVRVNNTHVLCRLVDFLDISVLGCQEPQLVVTFGGLEIPVAIGRIKVLPPNITGVVAPMGPQGAVEVGSGLLYEVVGRGFGTAANGALSVQVGDRACAVENRSDTSVSCRVEGPLRSNLGYLYPQVSNASIVGNAVKITVAVPVRATLGSLGAGCAPISDSWPHHRVHLLACPPGERRASPGTTESVLCAPGEFQPYTGPFLQCEKCPIGRYQDAQGQTACKACPSHKTTDRVASTTVQQCLCQVGHFLPNDVLGADSPCTPCPSGAVCSGSLAPPVATAGFWLHTDETVTPCTFNGCMGNNTCREGYMEEARCENCEINWYADIFENACKQCSAWVPFVTWSYVAVVILFICLVIVPLIAWKARRELNPELTEVPWICCGSLKGILQAMIFGNTGKASATKVTVTDELPWPRTRRIMTVLKCMEWRPFKDIVEGAEFQRVVNILVNNTQILYLVAGVGVKYWPSSVQDFIMHLSYVLGDVETLKPDCFMSLSAPNRWFLMWVLPYFLYAVFMIAVRLQSSSRVRNRGPILTMMSGAALLYLFPPHLMTIMQAFDCIQINDAKRSWVLDIDRSVYCYNYFGLSDNPDNLWSTMATVAGLDLMFLCVLMFFVGRAVYRSYWWYREQELGAPPLSSVFLTWWWVVGCRGFSAKHRYAVRGLKTQLAASTMNLSPSEVGGLCEDLFARNLAELQSGLSSMASELRSSHLWNFLEDIVPPAEKEHQNGSKKQNLQTIAAPKPVRANTAAFSRSGTSWSMSVISEELSKGLTKTARPQMAPWERRRQLRRSAYTALSAQLGGIVASWQTMSSFASHETASLLSYMWELVIAVNKLGLAFIRVYTTHDPGIGMRAACFWSFFFTVLVIAVQPYRHPGLNVLECTFSALITFSLASVLVLELWEGDLTSGSILRSEASGFHVLFQVANFILVMSVLVLALVMFIAWIYYYVRDLAFKDALYVLDPDMSDFGVYASETVSSDGGAAQCQQSEYKPKARVLNRVVRRKSEVVGDDQELEAQWMFCSSKLPGTATVVLEQGLGITVRDEAMLRRIIDAEGDPISMQDPLPGDLQGLTHCGEFRLTRGGDLTGRLVLRLNGKLEANLVDLWKLQDKSPDFSLKEPLRIGGKTVPLGARLEMVRFAPPGTPEHLAKNERPEDFLAKLVAAGDSGLRGVHGLLILEFERPDTPQDVHLELCELIVGRDEVPGEGGDRGEIEEARDSAEAQDPTDLARTVSADLVLPLELRLAPANAQVTLQVFKEPAFGCFDKVLVLGRYGQQWLLRAAELDLRLGITSENEEIDFDLGRSACRRSSEAGKESHTGHGGFTHRSVWRTRDGGVVVIHDSRCWGGSIDLEKPEDAYHVEMGELYGIPVFWHSHEADAQDLPIPGWFDGVSINWFENQNAENIALEVEGPSRQLPPSPWVRIRSASEEGGIPGPDLGMWSLVTHFYTQCHGPLPRAHVERVSSYQAGEGARELFIRSTRDSLFEKTQRELLVPFLSPADFSAAIGPVDSRVTEAMLRENSFSTLASFSVASPRGLLSRGSTPLGSGVRGASPRFPNSPARTNSLPENQRIRTRSWSTFSELFNAASPEGTMPLDRGRSGSKQSSMGEAVTPRGERRLGGIQEGATPSPPSSRQPEERPRRVMALGED